MNKSGSSGILEANQWHEVEGAVCPWDLNVQLISPCFWLWYQVCDEPVDNTEVYFDLEAL